MHIKVSLASDLNHTWCSTARWMQIQPSSLLWGYLQSVFFALLRKLQDQLSHSLQITCISIEWWCNSEVKCSWTSLVSECQLAALLLSPTTPHHNLTANKYKLAGQHLLICYVTTYLHVKEWWPRWSSEWLEQYKHDGPSPHPFGCSASLASLQVHLSIIYLHPVTTLCTTVRNAATEMWWRRVAFCSGHCMSSHACQIRTCLLHTPPPPSHKQNFKP